jgi:NAD(P)-dependent dehydrogenase (short-subunit alcohol dehydrogenase family)
MIALVTGGTRGIGAACVRALKQAGHTVAVIGRSDDFKDADLYMQEDLTSNVGQMLSVEWVIKKLGGLDILVNNAGSQNHASFIDYDWDDWDYQIKLMLTAPFKMSQEAAHQMLATSGGHIVNILSTAALQGARNIAGYVAAKHGLLGLTRAMAIELAPKIHVNAIVPGLTNTDMLKDMSPQRRALLESITPAGRFCEPEEVADALMYLVNSTGVYGQTVVVDGGWMAKNG